MTGVMVAPVVPSHSWILPRVAGPRRSTSPITTVSPVAAPMLARSVAEKCA